MESSTFNDSHPIYDSQEPLPVNGSTCDAYKVKLYGKLHFMKQLKPQYANDIRYREALRKEFETGFSLEHPHLVRYISCDGTSIVMEHVDGDTLQHLLTTDPAYFTKKEHTDRLLLQLMDAVHYLHSHQVLHLDLKPANIMLTHVNHDVKLIDLGCCKTDSFIDTQGHTEQYAAPEQLSGGDVDNRTDIYAIGKIIEQLPNHHIYNKVISKCTAQDKSQRYQSVDELKNDIRQKSNIRQFTFIILMIIALVNMALVLYNLMKSDNPKQQPAPQVSVVDTIIQRTVIQQDTLVIKVDDVKKKEPAVASVQQVLKELQSEILKAYESTIKTFNDSVFPPLQPSPDGVNYWGLATTRFNNLVKESVNRLSDKYPHISPSLLEMEASQRFQGLVGTVFNKMRENHPSQKE